MTQGQRTPRFRLPRFVGAWCAILCLICCLEGCQLPDRLAASKTGAPQYERANIVYELDGTQRPLPLAGSEIKPAAFESEEESPPTATEWAGATLSIQYPHPDGMADTARATLRLSAEPQPHSLSAGAQARRWLGWNKSLSANANSESSGPHPPTRDDEIWVLDIPKPQLDLLLTELQGNGFFQAQTRAESGTKLDVQLNWGRVQKEWSAEPRLDHFMARVYREGRLGGLVAKDSAPDHTNVLAGR